MMPALPIEGYDTTREDGVTRIRPVYAAPLPVDAVSVQGQGFPQETPALPVELPVERPGGILADVDRALSGAVRAPFDALDERLFGKSGKKGTYREAIQKFFKTGPSDEVKTGVNRLLGTGGEERYKTWPEKLVVDAITAPGNVLKSETPVTTEELIKPALDVSNLAGTGGLAGVGSGAGVALGSGPIRQAATAAMTKSEKPFYSALERSLGSINQNKASGEQWLGMLANKGGVKPDELQWSGIGEFLAGKPSVTKAEIDSFLKDNPFGVQEVVKGARDPAAQSAFAAYSKELSDKYGVPEGQNISMYAKLKNISDEEVAKYRELQEAAVGTKTSTKYHDYQLPGGENYREVLMTLPDKQKRLYEWEYFDPKTQQSKQFKTEAEAKAAAPEGAIVNQKEIAELNPSYKSSHWDEPNILAHMRMNDRTIDGKKSLHLEEIQSDWHQAGRKQGYKGEGLPKTDPRPELEKATAVLNDIDKNYPYDGSVGYKTYVNSLPAEIKAKHDKAQSDIAKLTPEVESYEKMLRGASDKVPDAPFKKNWHELALKRAIREAAENGYERLSWTPGEAQAARYDLSKQVDQIKYLKNDDGTYNIVPFKNNAPMHAIEREAVSADKLADIVGKEVAEKIIKDQGKREGKDIGVLEGADLKVGGEGMKGFYDNIVPKTIEKLGKQFGVKVKVHGVTLEDATKQLKNFEKSLNSKPMNAEQKREWNRLRDQIGDAKNGKIYYIDIPPAMRDKVLAEGFPLFSANVPVIDNDQTR